VTNRHIGKEALYQFSTLFFFLSLIPSFLSYILTKVMIILSNKRLCTFLFFPESEALFIFLSSSPGLNDLLFRVRYVYKKE